MNKYTGEVDIKLGEKTCTLIYDWRAIAQIQSTLGKDFITDLQKNVNPGSIAEVLVIGLKKKNPEVTVDQILDASPPLLHTIEIVATAIGFAYFGAEGVPEKAGAADPEKKT